MPYTLVIVESPAKCQKIEKYLGAGYKCIASYGHMQELNGLKSINMDTFVPSFTPMDSKRQQIERIRQMITNSNDVLLATDDDREGEGIAWHICKLFDLSIENTKRIIFHEVTETALKKSVQNPLKLNMNMVNAQQGRQILDLLVGYKISPLLWENISRTKKGLSAGRCQTPALRLVYDNQKEIDKSPGRKVYNTTGYFTDHNLDYTLNHNFEEEEKVIEFLEETTEFAHIFSCSKPKESIKKPPTPFTTSSLQQTASNELHISPKETMSICQKLYEGGYITYMRTDSQIYSKEFIEKIKPYIHENYGEEYIHKNIDNLSEKQPEKANKKSKKKKDENNNAQEAHEAIRPTNISCTKLPEEMESKEKRMYNLIWKTTMESCMADAIFNSITSKISAPLKYEYKYTAEELVFLGWKIVGGYKDDGKYYKYLLALKQNSEVKYRKIANKLTIKDLKMHYTEAKLVQLLEQKGIGRPSTYSSLIDKIQERGYVKKENIKGKKIKCTDFELENDEITEIEKEREFGNENNKLVIQDTGILVLEYLLKTFATFFEYEYTKEMEDELDYIAKGEKEYQELCKKCVDTIDESIPKKQYKSSNNNNNINGMNGMNDNNDKNDNTEIKIDDNHSYIIAKYGPTIKCKDGEKITFKSVKKNIDIDKLRNGDYNIEELIENDNRILGEYKGNTIYIKKGKYGLYVEWGSNKKSLNELKKSIESLELAEVVEYIENNENTGGKNCIRVIDKNLSIRNGKFGNYIFYKTESMNKPQFFKLNGFKGNYETCSLTSLKKWIEETHLK